MKGPPQLQAQMQAWFPPLALAKLREAGEAAAEQGFSLYLIGGCVRDLLLEREFVWDLDLVSETYGLEKLARSLQRRWGGHLQSFEQYGTAKLRLERLEFDFATARTERYAHPGAKPEVSFSRLDEDLIRRDFTVNAMAVGLLPHQFGALIDPFGGWADLQARQLRTLYEAKFREDPVRCWRAVRFSHQLGFTLEAWTHALLRAAMAGGGFDRFFTARMRRELGKVLAMPHPLACLRDLHANGVLRGLDPQLDWPWLEAYCTDYLATRAEAEPGESADGRAAALGSAGPESPEARETTLLLGIVAAISPSERPAALAALEMDRAQIQAWQAFERILALEVDWGALRPSQIYQLLDKTPDITLAALAASPDAHRRQAVENYARTWRFVRPGLSGTIIKEWIPAGPAIRQILQALLLARLDGLIASPEQELALAQKLSQELADKPARAKPEAEAT